MITVTEDIGSDPPTLHKTRVASKTDDSEPDEKVGSVPTFVG